MGVKQLWDVLDPIKKTQSLTLLAEEHRAVSQGMAEADATLRVGVDMGTYMGTCNAGAKKAGVHGQLPGGGLYVFFKRLVELILSPVTFVFVFDGPERPNFKRGHEVRHKKVWWTNLAIELIQYFGQVVHQAPGEAEAELARLNTEGYIDAVITSDGDTYVFGANCVLRTIYQKAKNHSDEYILYRSQTRQPYTRGGLILFALLTGGDYDTGLHRCGPGSAIALAKCGFGDQLVDAFEHLNCPDFDRFLIQWRCNIRAELHSNSRGHLERCQPKLAMDIPDTFPARRTLELYINPVTSWSPGQVPPSSNQWEFTQPSIPAITAFCRDHLYFKNRMKLRTMFKANLWKGIFLQMVYSPSAEYISKEGRVQLPGSGQPTAVISRMPRQDQDEPQPKLEVSVPEFVKAMGYNFAESLSMDKISVSPRESLLPEALRQALHENKKKPKKKARAPPAPLHVIHQKKKKEIEFIRIGEKHWFADLTSD